MNNWIDIIYNITHHYEVSLTLSISSTVKSKIPYQLISHLCLNIQVWASKSCNDFGLELQVEVVSKTQQAIVLGFIANFICIDITSSTSSDWLQLYNMVQLVCRQVISSQCNVWYLLTNNILISLLRIQVCNTTRLCAAHIYNVMKLYVKLFIQKLSVDVQHSWWILHIFKVSRPTTSQSYSESWPHQHTLAKWYKLLILGPWGHLTSWGKTCSTSEIQLRLPW